MLWLSAGFAGLYGLRYTSAPVSWPRSAIKTVPLTALGIAAASSGNLLLSLALFLSAIGDFALSRPGERAFLTGLVSFALAHVVYVALFLPAAHMPPLGVTVLLILLVASTSVWLLPHTGNLRVPVAGYVGLIGAMGIAAWGQPDGLVRAGATAFILSDLLLALETFRNARGLSIPLWALYWLGQALIVTAYLGFPGIYPV